MSWGPWSPQEDLKAYGKHSLSFPPPPNKLYCVTILLILNIGRSILQREEKLDNRSHCGCLSPSQQQSQDLFLFQLVQVWSDEACAGIWQKAAGAAPSKSAGSDLEYAASWHIESHSSASPMPYAFPPAHLQYHFFLNSLCLLRRLLANHTHHTSIDCSCKEFAAACRKPYTACCWNRTHCYMSCRSYALPPPFQVHRWVIFKHRVGMFKTPAKAEDAQLETVDVHILLLDTFKDWIAEAAKLIPVR